MEIKEIKIEDLNPKEFINQKVKEISDIVGDGTAINALSGGVDSSVVTMLGHKALGDRLKTYFIDNGLMRYKEAEQINDIFEKLGVNVKILDAQQLFLYALKGIEDPEEKREAITQTFYKDVFKKLVIESDAKYLLHGTILTDVDETVAGIKRQHNIFEQIGINPEEAFGYKIIEPLVQLRKDSVRKVAKALDLPESIYNRMPFPGPALAARIIGEATPGKLVLVRMATKIVEDIIGNEVKPKPFQYLAILHKDKVTGIKAGKRDYGCQIEIRCWDSIDARTATPTKLPYETLDKITQRIMLFQGQIAEVEHIVSVTYNIAPKPPSTIEAI